MFVTKKEITKAKEYDVLSYLMIANPHELVRVSNNEYCLRSHDSFRISNGLWHWFSRGRGGRSAVDYLVHVKSYSFPAAVIEVNRVMDGADIVDSPKSENIFSLPTRNEDNEQVISYLKSRSIDDSLIKVLIDKGLIYEDREHHSAIFVGENDEGIPAYAAYRATDGSSNRGEVQGSKKKYSFRLSGTESTLHVFEGAIDLLSFITICIRNKEDFGRDSYLSLGGVTMKVGHLPQALEHYLEVHQGIKTVVLHLDNDKAGHECSAAICKLLEGRYEVIEAFPEHGKDVNSSLQTL